MRLSPELRFISDVLGLSLKPSHSCIRVKSLVPSDHINWRNFIRVVTYHGIAGLLLHWMKELKLGSTLPRDVHESLQGIHESQRDIWQNHRWIIKKILKGFHGSGIEVILLKGAQLGQIDYPHFSLRPMEDIDLLVKRSNQARVIKRMLDMGFNLYETGQTCNKFFIRWISNENKKEAHKPIFIEIHSNLQVPNRLNKSFSIDMDELWIASQRRTSTGFPFLQLSPTHNLLYLCSHFSEHLFSRLIWAYDIALHIHRHREEIDWGRLEDLCGRMKIRSTLYHSLRLCRELFRVSVPKEVLKTLSVSPLKMKLGEFLIRRNLLFPEESRRSRLGRFLTMACSIDNWAEAIVWFLFPTRKWIKTQYSLQSTRGIYSYYILHPILYLIRAVRAPMR